MASDDTLARAEIDRAVHAIEPEWQVREASPVRWGQHAIVRLQVETPAAARECYLKATPSAVEPSVGLEARLLAVLRAHTSLPVPEVLGVVDSHDTLPAPFVLLGALPGETIPRTRLPTLADDELRSIARDVGRQLVDLHALDAVAEYGFLTYRGGELAGGEPTGTLETIAIVDPMTDWRDRLRDWADGTLESLAETRFADVAPKAEPVVHAQIDELEGPFRPALARIDAALENLRVSEGRVRGLLDWEFTIAATPANDLVAVAWSLAGGPYLFKPGVADRRDLVREALLEGYRERGPAAVADRVRANRECYELLTALRSMAHLREWYRQFDLDSDLECAADALRAEVDARLSAESI